MPIQKLNKQLLGASSLVIEMAVLVLVAAFAANWLDQQLESSPIMLLLGLGSSLVLGIIRLIRTVERINKSDEE